MDRRRLARLVGVGMVALGLLQVALGLRGGGSAMAAFGAVYSLLGVAYLWAEGTADR